MTVGMCEHARQLVYPGGDRMCLDCYTRYAAGIGWQRPEVSGPPHPAGHRPARARSGRRGAS